MGIAFGLLTGCMSGPDYTRPQMIAPEKFKESVAQATSDAARKGWKPITPLDLVDRGRWWQVFGDRELTTLEDQVDISNQTVAAAAAGYEAAAQIVREGTAGLFPSISASYTPSRTRTPRTTTSSSASTSSSTSSAGAAYANSFKLGASVNWELDLWGRIRRTIEADAAAAQVSAADLVNARLSAQVQLAIAYFNLRATDELVVSIEDTLIEFRRTRDILKNQYEVGISSRADFITADSQVLTTEAQILNLAAQRAQYEHAIAMLTGRNPSELSVPARRWKSAFPPTVPERLPSTLLERRPDIAAAERQLQQLNALVGVAVANFYPKIILSPGLSFAGINPWPVTAAQMGWTLVGGATQPLFDGGLLDAQHQAAKANYLQGVANYRQTVLVAFQQVEDQLAAIRQLSGQVRKLDRAVKEAHDAVGFYRNQYRAGTVPFTSVVTAQSNLLSNIRSAVTARQGLFVATATLIGALGGDWDASKLPSIEALVVAQRPPLPVPISAIPAALDSGSAH
jgi:NodT family efflux transporter outer membrane factor (OMF) lipoprotein